MAVGIEEADAEDPFVVTRSRNKGKNGFPEEVETPIVLSR